LRRLPWSEAHVVGESVLTHFAAERFGALDELQRDEWPGR